jgi:hypothetical protein
MTKEWFKRPKIVAPASWSAPVFWRFFRKSGGGIQFLPELGAAMNPSPFVTFRQSARGQAHSKTWRKYSASFCGQGNRALNWQKKVKIIMAYSIASGRFAHPQKETEVSN